MTLNINQLLIFTDLDATLLDHDTYSFEPAKSLLQWFKNHNVPVIPTTSKTSAELAELRVKLDNNEPYIVENGACIYIPTGYFNEQPQDTTQSDCGNFWIKEWGGEKSSSRTYWQGLIDKACTELNLSLGVNIETFKSLGNEGIARVTGLSPKQASLSNQRQNSEPVYIVSKDSEQRKQLTTALSAKLRELGAGVVEGGRFLHVMAPGTSKGAALEWLSQVYNSGHDNSEHDNYEHDNYEHGSTIALGDSQNDIDMLEKADYAILIRNPHKPFPALSRQEGVMKSEATGPQGWRDSLCAVLGIELD